MGRGRGGRRGGGGGRDGGGRGGGRGGHGGGGRGGRGGGGRGGRGGRGGSRGRGGGGRWGRDETTLTHKDESHVRQFGEKHPSQEMGNFKGPSAKRGKFDFRGRGRFASGTGNNGGSFASGIDKRSPPEISSESGSSEDEEDTTPYNELLAVFSGGKSNSSVKIISDDEEEDDDEDDSVESDDAGSDSSIEEQQGQGEMVEGDRNEDESSSEDDEEEKDEGSEAEDTNEDEAETVPSEEIKVEEDDNVTDVPEDTVIDDAEIDPEIDDDLAGIDPFNHHYEREMSASLQQKLKAERPATKNYDITWPIIERFTYTGFVRADEDEDDIKVLKSSIDLSEFDRLPNVKIPDIPASPIKNFSLASLHIKKQLYSTIPHANQASIDKQACKQELTPLQTELIDLASRYHDVYCPIRTINTAEEIRLAYCLHAANHILKTRTRILHHNAKMSNKSEVPEAYRDQGFVRPKVLILVPFKDSALRVVTTLISLILKEEKGNVANKKRFCDEYGGQTLFMPKTNPKPDDYMNTFNGNVDDNFKIGMAVTKKSIKLYTGFYSSDVIIASPLGLRVIVGAEGEKDRDYDFLSSIELVILDQSDVFLMQNWDHVLHIMRHLHLQPVTTHGTDFSRIRPWALDGLSKYYCQTLMFSSVACPEHSSLMSKHCKNYGGQARILQPNPKGCIFQVTVQLPQVFQMFDAASVADVDDARFEHFTKQLLPNFKEKLLSHTLIFVSSYFDFVRIRNYFKREEVSFVQICEYTKDKKIARSRDLFFHGSNHFLLYTERAHFFRRFRLKGVGHIIFYQLPQNPQFYPELCNFVQESFQTRRVRQRKNSSVNVMYCKYDAPRLAAIVGTERAAHMLSSDKKTHAFVSGEL